MLWLLFSFAISAGLTLWVVRSSRSHGRFSADHDLSGPQKFHAPPVQRVGGLGIFGALLLVALGMAWWRNDASSRLALMLLACGLPAVVAGLVEDLTKRVSPSARLLATAASASMAVWLLDASVIRTDLPGVDWIAGTAVGAALLAVLTVAGIANAVNIIDGFNGLASMCVLMMLVAITYVAYQVGDTALMTAGLIGAGALLGFFVWNYPAGLIFLGDGGAYFLGFYLAELGILLVHRNPGVSPLFPLLLAIYPVFETLFSMYRRKFVRGRAFSMPDGVHLHSLIYRRVLRWAIGSQDARTMTRRNSMTAPYLWMLCMMAVGPSLLFWDDSRILGAFILVFGVTYVVLYAKIVRFKAPRWMVIRR
jgi:UDP-N-acetylmuramyl pentapeptide phosphotransferase/UDP-N-acetylglucosamine-1-phosphate transferase